MKKKILAIALVLAMVFTLAACGEEATTAEYTIDGCAVPMFPTTNVSSAIVFDATAGLPSSTSTLSSLSKAGMAYIYIMKTGVDAEKAANDYCSSLTANGSGLLDRYIQIGALTEKLADNVLSTMKLDGLEQLIGTKLLFNAKTSNVVLVAHVNVQLTGTNVVLVIPDLVKAAGGSELLKTITGGDLTTTIRNLLL